MSNSVTVTPVPDDFFRPHGVAIYCHACTNGLAQWQVTAKAEKEYTARKIRLCHQHLDELRDELNEMTGESYEASSHTG